MTAVAMISPASQGIIQVVNENNLSKIERYLLLMYRFTLLVGLSRQNGKQSKMMIDPFAASSTTLRTEKPLRTLPITIADYVENDVFVCLSSTRRQVKLLHFKAGSNFTIRINADYTLSMIIDQIQ